MVSLLDVVGEQIRSWLAENPGAVIVTGLAGLVVADRITGGLVRDTIFKAYDFLREWLVKAYDIVTLGLSYIGTYVYFLFQNFSFDNPKKTMLLSVVFYLCVVGLVLAFSRTSWSGGGVDTLESKEFTVGDFNGLGGIGSGGLGGGGVTSTITTVPPLYNYSTITVCRSDADCVRVYGEGSNVDIKCCYPTVYAGYACAGQCLKISGADRSACKHPAACYNANFDVEALDARIKADDSGCLGKSPSPDSFCEDLGAAFCCKLAGTANFCYGYCSISGGSCSDVSKCYEEKDNRVG